MTPGTRRWLRGLESGVITGISTAGLNWITQNAAHAAGFNVPLQNVEAFGLCLGSAALVALFTYLKQFPLPDDPGDNPPPTQGIP